MELSTQSMLIYAAIAVGGYFLRWLQARNNPTPAPDNATPPANPLPILPGSPGRISIGHGELLSMLLSMLFAPPPVPIPSVPLPPTPPQDAPDNTNALLRQLLNRLNAPPATN